MPASGPSRGKNPTPSVPNAHQTTSTGSQSLTEEQVLQNASSSQQPQASQQHRHHNVRHQTPTLQTSFADQSSVPSTFRRYSFDGAFKSTSNSLDSSSPNKPLGPFSSEKYPVKFSKSFVSQPTIDTLPKLMTSPPPHDKVATTPDQHNLPETPTTAADPLQQLLYDSPTQTSLIPELSDPQLNRSTTGAISSIKKTDDSGNPISSAIQGSHSHQSSSENSNESHLGIRSNATSSTDLNTHRRAANPLSNSNNHLKSDQDAEREQQLRQQNASRGRRHTVHQVPPPRNIIDRLREFSLFKSAPESFLNEIASKLRPMQVSAQEFVITEGEEARAMYWILRGSVGIVSLDGESVHAELGPGAFFGEIGILFDRPRTASVQTRTRCLLVVLTADSLNEVLPSYPEIERLIRDEAQERLAVLEKNRKVREEQTGRRVTLEASSSSNETILVNPMTVTSVPVAQAVPEGSLEQVSTATTEHFGENRHLYSSSHSQTPLDAENLARSSVSSPENSNLPPKRSRADKGKWVGFPPAAPSDSSSVVPIHHPRPQLPRQNEDIKSPSTVGAQSQSQSPNPLSYVTRRGSIGDQTFLENARIRQILEDVGLFSSVPANILHKLALSFEPQSFPPFEVIVKQGSAGKDIYFILDGSVEVIDEKANITITRLTRGSYFGEMAFLSLVPQRAATVRTITETACIILPAHALESLCSEYPEIHQQIEATARQRMENNKQHVWDVEGMNNVASPMSNEAVDNLHLKHRNHHTSVSSSSSSEHNNPGMDLKSKPLDRDPFAVTRKDDEQSESGDNGLGMFSKSWNTDGAFDTALKPPALEEPLDPMDPRCPASSFNESPKKATGETSQSIVIEPSNDSVAFKSFNFSTGRRNSVVQLPVAPSVKQPSVTPPPENSKSKSPTPVLSSTAGASSAYDDIQETQQAQSQQSVAPNQRDRVSQLPAQFHTLQQAVPIQSQPLQQSPDSSLQLVNRAPLPGGPQRRSKSVSFFPGTHGSLSEHEEGPDMLLADPPIDSIEDRRRRFSQTMPSVGSVGGLGGLLLHPRVKRVRYSGRRRSSLFNIGPFPDFLQIRIFQHLNLKDLMRLRRVCQHWRQMLQTSSSLMKVLDLSKFNTTITDQSIIPITNFAGTRPKVVDISDCFHLTDEGFSYLVNGIGLAKIQVFKMKSVWEVTGMAIMDITVPSIGSDLQEIDLSNCRKVGDATLSRLIGWVVPPQYPGSTANPHEVQQSVPGGTVVGCQKLKRISLSYCKHITDRSMYHMAMFASDRLESLNLTRCTSITDHGFSYWALRQFTALTYLCLADCTFLTDKAIMAIASAAKNLQSLVISFCCALTDVSVEVLALGCPALRSLDLAFCGSAVSDNSITSVALHLLELERLSLRGCIRVTNSGINQLLAESHKLQYLDVTQCRNVVAPLNVPPISYQPPPSSVIIGGHFSHTAHPAPHPDALTRAAEQQLQHQIEAHAQAAEAKAIAEAQAQAQAHAHAVQYSNYGQMMPSYYGHHTPSHQMHPGLMNSVGQGHIPQIMTPHPHASSQMISQMPSMNQIPMNNSMNPQMNQIVPLGTPGTPSTPVPGPSVATANTPHNQYTQNPMANPMNPMVPLDHMNTELPGQPHQPVRPFVFIKMN